MFWVTKLDKHNIALSSQQEQRLRETHLKKTPYKALQKPSYTLASVKTGNSSAFIASTDANTTQNIVYFEEPNCPPELNSLTAETITHAYGNTLKKVHEGVQHLDPGADSGVTIGLIHKDMIHVSHVGVSVALVVNLNNWQYERLNCAHHPDLALQRQDSTFFSNIKVTKEDSAIYSSSQNLLAAAENNDNKPLRSFKKLGPSPANHSESYSFNMDTDDEYAVLLYTNNIREKMSEEAIVNFLKKNHDNNIAKRINALNQHAYEQGCEGDSKIVALKVKRDMTAAAKPILVGLFEGDQSVANHIKDSFAKAFEDEIKEKYSDQLFEKLKYAIDETRAGSLKNKLIALQKALTAKVLEKINPLPLSLDDHHPFKKLEKATCKLASTMNSESDETVKLFATKKYHGTTVELGFWETNKTTLLCTIIGGIVGACIGLVIGIWLSGGFPVTGMILAVEGAFEGAVIGAAVGAALLGTNTKRLCRFTGHKPTVPNIEDAIDEAKVHNLAKI